jgi:tetratricopeptide (TPR) repeat protein
VSWRSPQSSYLVFLITCQSLLPFEATARQSLQGTSVRTTMTSDGHPRLGAKDVDIYIKGPNGSPFDELTLVILTAPNGHLYRKETTRAGYIRFKDVARAEYTLQVVSASYQMMMKSVDAKDKSAIQITVELTTSRNSNQGPLATRPGVLPRNAQKELGKAMEALRVNAPSRARTHLEALYGLVPDDAEANYLFGVYSAQLNDWEQAEVYWIKSLQLDPKHFRALLSLSDRLLSENKSEQALTLALRAVDVEPTSWRSHAMLANAYYQQGAPAAAIQEAERALQLGHQQAELVEPLLAKALATAGDNERASSILQTYLRDRPIDDTSKKHFASRKVSSQPTNDATAGLLSLTISSSAIPSTWLPPDVDENVPPVEADAACAIDTVIQRAGERVLEFVANVDRFAATESITHESINKWGGVSFTETRTFDYLVSISEVRTGLFDVEEYRTRRASLGEFPDGVETRGLPSMALLFHPAIAGNYEITCEGMARVSRGLAWQVHFRQRPDKPNIMRSYRVGLNGPSHPVALRGRAWIAADTYQILRMETDLVTPLPDIRLFADHTAIDYGAVQFRNRQVQMWLPLSAEVYYDWRGRRAHRRHTFSNYLLFSVDEKQHISQPKSADLLPIKQ